MLSENPRLNLPNGQSKFYIVDFAAIAVIACLLCCPIVSLFNKDREYLNYQEYWVFLFSSILLILTLIRNITLKFPIIEFASPVILLFIAFIGLLLKEFIISSFDEFIYEIRGIYTVTFLLYCFVFWKLLLGRIFTSIFKICSLVIPLLLAIWLLDGVVIHKFGIYESIGGFENTGIYAILIVCYLPFLTVNLVQNKCKSKIILAWHIILTILLITSIIILRSRTAMFCMLILFTWTLGYLYGRRIIHYFKRKKFWIKTSIVIILVGIVLIILFSLFNFKVDSSKGRLLVYNVSSKIFSDNWLLGVGVNKFKAVYNLYQAHYLSDPQSLKSYFNNVDNIQVAYNEYLQFLIENGSVVSAILFASVGYALYLSIQCNFDESSNIRTDVSSFLTFVLLVFSSLFYYPLHNWAIVLIALFVFVNIDGSAWSIKKPINNRVISCTLGILFTALLPLFARLEFKIFGSSLEWRYIAEKSLSMNFEKVKGRYELNYDVMRFNERYLYNYGTELFLNGSYLESIKILEEANARIANTDVLCVLANGYRSVGNYGKAIECLQLAVKSVPSKLRPKYYLMKFYNEVQNHDSAIYWSHVILTQPIKVHSEEISEILEEARLVQSVSNPITIY